MSLSNETVDVPDVKDNNKSGSRTFFLSVLDTIPQKKKKKKTFVNFEPEHYTGTSFKEKATNLT